MFWYLRVILSKLGFKRKYTINNVEILIDWAHRLPDYQKSHAFYDRILPQVVKNLSPGSRVIDVGANIGDTVAAMIGSNKDLEYVCIEADDQFYIELQTNIQRIKSQIPNAKIKPLKYLVGLSITNVTLEGRGGTKHAVKNQDATFGGLKSMTLESIFSDLKIDTKSISLLKSDVDGFDYDVIASAGKILDHRPLIFFECMYEIDSQLAGYRNLFKYLIDTGYTYFAFFDNFGHHILTCYSFDQINELLEYVSRQNVGIGARTINYYDVLCFNKESEGLVTNSITNLKQEFA